MSDTPEAAPTIRSDDSAWNAALSDLVRRCGDIQAEELATMANACCATLGIDVTLYLVDHEQRRFRPIPETGKPAPATLAVEGTVGGRAFATVATLTEESERGVHLWIPMVDGSERLGLAEVHASSAPRDPDRLQHNARTLVALLAHLVRIKTPYGDLLTRIRRTQPMTTSGELLLSMLPPLTFSCREVLFTAVLEPSYDVGGDAYDYAVDGPTTRFMILDAMGRGTQAALTSAAVLAATRASRRDGRGRHEMARAADTVVSEQFRPLRFATAVLGELDTRRGLLRYLNAGHPAPILLRDGRAVRTLTGGRRLPLGLPDAGAVVGEARLEPGDRVLMYTDGVTETRDRDGESGVDWLAEAARRSHTAGLPAAEMLRWLSRAVITRGDHRKVDDATLVLLEWPHTAAGGPT